MGTGMATLKGAVLDPSLNITSRLSSINILAVEGSTEDNIAVTVPVNSGFKMTTNLEQQTLNTYSLMFDIRSTHLDGYTPFFQNDLSNAKDGSLFIKDGQR